MTIRFTKFTTILFIVTAAVLLTNGALTVSAQRRTRTTRTTTTTPAQTKPAPATLNNEDTLTMIRRKGRLDVGLSLFTPWSMHDKDGKLIGFEIEVSKKLAEDLGVQLELHPVGFIETLADLNNKRFDIVATGLYATPGRALTVNFSDPYSHSKIEVIASRSVMKGENDMEDFDKPEITFGIVSGTIYGDYVTDNFPKAKQQMFEDETAMLEALADGKIAAGISASPTPEFVSKHSDGKIYKPFRSALGQLGESFAIRKGDVDFLNFLNTWIRYYEETGWLKRERKYWFENTDWADKL